MELLAEERQTGATSGGTEPTPISLIPTGNELFGIASLGCCVVSSDSYVPLIGRKRSDESLRPSGGSDTVDEQESTIERGVSVSFAPGLNISDYIDELDSGVHRGGSRERLPH